MQSLIASIVTWLDRVRVTPIRGLLFGNVLSVSVLIYLSNVQVLPLRPWDFIFFSILFFLIALYRSGFVFALLVGMLPLETVNLAPLDIGINLRPYQFLAPVLLLSVFVRLVTKRVKWPLFEVSWLDWVMGGFLVSGFLMIPFLPFPELIPVALKQGIILLSFGLLYLLSRIFLKKESDIRIALLFFFSSVFIVLCYSLWQSLHFAWHLPSFEVMSGRPNGTFPEADFLGGVLAMILSGMVPFGLAFFFRENGTMMKKSLFAVFFFSLFLILILSVARSGWLAAGVGMIAGGGIFFLKNGIFSALRKWDTEFLRRALFAKLFVGLPIAFALVMVIIFHLTAFNLFDRGESVASGLQKITVSCMSSDTILPETLHTIDELALNGCRHILLEEIDGERQSGHFVREVYRSDPNISVRKQIYAQSFELISAHPISGIGFGNVSHFLGIDGNGRGLNASNVFLEVWLGAGLFGFIAFLIFWLSFPILLLRQMIRTSERGGAVVSISLFASWVALTVFNCFNSGLLLGTLWIFFAMLVWGVNAEFLQRTHRPQARPQRFA